MVLFDRQVMLSKLCTLRQPPSTGLPPRWRHSRRTLPTQGIFHSGLAPSAPGTPEIMAPQASPLALPRPRGSSLQKLPPMYSPTYTSSPDRLPVLRSLSPPITRGSFLTRTVFRDRRMYRRMLDPPADTRTPLPGPEQHSPTGTRFDVHLQKKNPLPCSELCPQS